MTIWLPFGLGVATIRHRDVCSWTDAYLRVVAETPWLAFGVVFHPWGVRLLLGSWHAIVHYRSAQ